MRHPGDRLRGSGPRRLDRARPGARSWPRPRRGSGRRSSTSSPGGWSSSRGSRPFPGGRSRMPWSGVSSRSSSAPGPLAAVGIEPVRKVERQATPEPCAESRRPEGGEPGDRGDLVARPACARRDRGRCSARRDDRTGESGADERDTATAANGGDREGRDSQREEAGLAPPVPVEEHRAAVDRVPEERAERPPRPCSRSRTRARGGWARVPRSSAAAACRRSRSACPRSALENASTAAARSTRGAKKHVVPFG